MDFRSLALFAYARVLPWVAPPVIGAVIGYVTNAIAIRMLFRPLREWRLFGLRLPFTPGIIPRQRYELAGSIGRMVSGELINAEAVRRQLSGEGFRGRLEKNITGMLGDLLDKPLAALAGNDRELLTSAVERFLAEALERFFCSESFGQSVRSLTAAGLHRLADLRLGQVLSGPQAASLVAERLLPSLAEPGNRRRLAGWVQDWLKRKREAPAASPLPPGVSGALQELVRGFLPPLLDRLFDWLDSEDERRELAERGKLLLREAFARLNVLQKFLLTASQFDRRLEQRMPEIVTDALRALRGYGQREQTRESLSRAAVAALELWRRQPAVGGGAEAGPAGRAVEGLLAVLEGEEVRRSLGAGVERLLGRWLDRPLGELAKSALRLEEPEAAEWVSRRLLSYLARQETAEAVAAELVGFTRRFLRENQASSLRQLLRVDEGLQARAGAWLSVQLLRIVDQRLPALLESVDIQGLVVDKINNLDVGQVEGLLLMVIARHLKWINIFGGILGALIGLVQLLLRGLR